MKLLGNLYRHGILQPDYKEEWIRRDKRRAEESVLWRYIDTDRMDYAAHAVVTSKTKHYELFCIGLISPTVPDRRRPPILVFVGQDKGTCFEAGIRAWLVARLRRGRRQARLMPTRAYG
jgi:hypothetical protein